MTDYLKIITFSLESKVLYSLDGLVANAALLRYHTSLDLKLGEKKSPREMVLTRTNIDV